jgi:very-short-patch-repair endonuclease
MRAELVQALAAVADRQHGAISVEQLRRLGISEKAQRGAIRTGWLAVAGPRVLVVRASPDCWARQLRVGLLALGDEAWVSHEAAARLHGLDRSIDAVEFTLPRDGRRSARRERFPGRVHTTGAVGPLDVVTLDGFRCSSATRTILDLAYIGTPTIRLEAAIDSAVRLGLSAPHVIAARLAELRGPGRRGARALDRLLVDSGGESRLERLFLQLVRRAGLPRPATQRVMRRDSRHVARVDFLFEASRVVVEVTGRVGHSSPADRQRDAQRRNELLELGYRVYEYTWADVTERPDTVVTSLRRRLAQVADRGPSGPESAT